MSSLASVPSRLVASLLPCLCAAGASLQGRDIAWSGPGGRFTGRVEGERIIGRFQSGGGSRDAVFQRAR